MTRKTNTNAAVALSAGILLSGPLATAQGLAKAAPPSPKGPAERSAATNYLKFAANFHKDRGYLTVVGMLNRSPVFKNTRGEYFQVDPNTGDLKYHSAESLGFMKVGDVRGKAARSTDIFIKFDGIKGEQRVSVAGVDAQGHVIQENSRGERFYLGPNGDMIFVK